MQVKGQSVAFRLASRVGPGGKKESDRAECEFKKKKNGEPNRKEAKKKEAEKNKIKRDKSTDKQTNNSYAGNCTNSDVLYFNGAHYKTIRRETRGVKRNLHKHPNLFRNGTNSKKKKRQ